MATTTNNIAYGVRADGISAASMLHESIIQTVSIDLTNAQIKALRATPVEFVAAPGAGYMVEFISATLFLDAGTNVLTESTDNLEFRWGAAGTAAATVETTGFIDQAADTMIHAFPATAAALAKTVTDNKALVLQNNGDGEIAGNAANDARLYVNVTYRIVPTGW